MEVLASFNIAPHSGVGACTPNPKNESVDILKIIHPISSVISTTSSGRIAGIICFFNI